MLNYLLNTKRYLCSLASLLQNASHFLFLSEPSCPDVPLWLHLCQLWRQDKKHFLHNLLNCFFLKKHSWRWFAHMATEDGSHPILCTHRWGSWCLQGGKMKAGAVGQLKKTGHSVIMLQFVSRLEDLLLVLLRNCKGSRQQHLLFGRKTGVTDCSTNACYDFSSWWGTIFLWSRTTGCCRSVELWQHEQCCQLFSYKLSASQNIIRRTADIV